MPLDDVLRERVVFFGGKATGVECPDCEFRSRDIDLSPHNVRDVTCPDCGATILTESQMSDLRKSVKL
ncbi:hypothetical protein [Halobacterium yunchengense]|uniref:hypothetical protein n=1 Tax=Halobacterium yunchengense TaxID=3108497 RepID=UPI003008DC73